MALQAVALTDSGELVHLERVPYPRLEMQEPVTFISDGKLVITCPNFEMQEDGRLLEMSTGKWFRFDETNTIVPDEDRPTGIPAPEENITWNGVVFFGPAEADTPVITEAKE